MRISYQQILKGRNYASQTETQNHFGGESGWVIERSFAWMTRFRRLARDYERLPDVLAGLHLLAFAVLMLHRFALVMTH